MMNSREPILLSKIVAELLLFAFNRNLTRIDLKIRSTANEETIRYRVEGMSEADQAVFLAKCSRHREAEIETYGWTLLGETDLEIAGLLIDEANVTTEENAAVFTLIRRRGA